MAEKRFSILYLTTALDEADYDFLWSKGFEMPNPSNQNFHGRLIKALRETSDVEVFCLVNRKYGNLRLLSNDHWRYVLGPLNPISKLFSSGKEIIKAAKAMNRKFDFILFDPLNYQFAKCIGKLAKAIDAIPIAILTDHPKNLSNTPSFVAKKQVYSVQNAHHCLSLSDGLLEAYGVKDAPSCVFEGVVEEPKESKSPREKPYIYFGGSLMRRYGAFDLVSAYLRSHPDYDLILAGHHLPDELIPLVEGNERIEYLGQLTRTIHEQYLQHAALVVNPRPYEETLDKESVPSKLLEYLVSGTPILSVSHSTLQKLFPKDVNWLSQGGEELSNFFQQHLDSDGHFKGLIPNKAKEKAISMYGLSAIGKKIQSFLESLNP